MKQRRFRQKALCTFALLAILSLSLFLQAAVSEETKSPVLSPSESARRANVPEGNWIWIDLPQKTLTLYQ